MLKVLLGKDSTTSNKQVQFLENKLNKLRWVNDELHKQVFDAVQRGHRLAVKVGYKDLDDAERALATQCHQGSEEQQSQLEQLSQYSSEELAGHVQALQAELVSHVQLSRSTLGALGDALEEIARLREDNERLREERNKARASAYDVQGTSADELAFARAELVALKQQFEDLRQAKQDADAKHDERYRGWKKYHAWLQKKDRKKEERAAKRRKPNPESDDEEKRRKDCTPKKGDRKRKSDRKSSSRSPRQDSPSTPVRAMSPCPAVLTSKSLNPASSTSPSSSIANAPPVSSDIKSVVHKIIKRNSTVKIPKVDDDLPASSETEPDSQPVTFLYPSQHDFSTIPQKRPHCPAPDSSETEVESQAPAFLLPSQIMPLTPARVVDIAPKPRPAAQRGEQLCTPVSIPRTQKHTKGKDKRNPDTGALPPPSPLRPNLSRPLPPLGVGKARLLPETPVSCPPKKGKERAIQNDENAPASTNPCTADKKFPSDYSIYKGRGRYGAEVQAGKVTINAMYEIDPEHNAGVGFQFEEVVRDKDKRKHMHAGDCECCRDYYQALGPLPSRLKAPMWRSPESSPSKRKKRKRDSFEDDENESGEGAAIEEHKHAISRHRQHWARAPTPPGYWKIGFPDTQEVKEMNAEAHKMHERKRAFVAVEAERGGKYRRR